MVPAVLFYADLPSVTNVSVIYGLLGEVSALVDARLATLFGPPAKVESDSFGGEAEENKTSGLTE